MIYGTVGTHDSDFGRLILALDEIAASTGERVVIQTGLSRTMPGHAEHFAFKPREEVLALQSGARVIVCHAGIGSIIDAMKARKPLIVVPRLRRFGEHNTDHQLDISDAAARRGWARAITEISELGSACANPPAPKGNYAPDRERLIRSVRSVICGRP